MSIGLSAATTTSTTASPTGPSSSSTTGVPPISCNLAARTGVAYDAMDAYRTPDERFENLPGYSFEPHYVEQDGLRMHYVDEGGGAPVLLFHGEPTWAFLYRTMIPPLVAAGLRCVAPDYLGFGRS